MDALDSLEVWRRSCDLSADLYIIFRASRDFGFKDQITRSGLSIASNIAEGYERNSHKEFVRYLRIAKGSCGELKTQLLIGRKAGLLGDSEAERLMAETRQISRMIYGLIRRYSPD